MSIISYDWDNGTTRDLCLRICEAVKGSPRLEVPLFRRRTQANAQCFFRIIRSQVLSQPEMSGFSLFSAQQGRESIPDVRGNSA